METIEFWKIAKMQIMINKTSRIVKTNQNIEPAFLKRQEKTLRLKIGKFGIFVKIDVEKENC